MGVSSYDDEMASSLPVQPGRTEKRTAIRKAAWQARSEGIRLGEEASVARAAALAACQIAAAAVTELEGLRVAMATRSTIDMAKGILMALHALDENAAFDRLRSMSQQQHRKLRDVAADIVRAVVKPGEV